MKFLKNNCLFYDYKVQDDGILVIDGKKINFKKENIETFKENEKLDIIDDNVIGSIDINQIVKLNKIMNIELSKIKKIKYVISSFIYFVASSIFMLAGMPILSSFLIDHNIGKISISIVLVTIGAYSLGIAVKERKKYDRIHKLNLFKKNKEIINDYRDQLINTNLKTETKELLKKPVTIMSATQIRLRELEKIVIMLKTAKKKYNEQNNVYKKSTN